MLLTTAEYDWTWEYHVSCNLPLDDYKACSWLSASAATQIRATWLSYARRLYPAYSLPQFDLQDTHSKGFRKGSSVYHFSGHRSTDKPAAYPGGWLFPAHPSVESLRMKMDLKRVVCWLGEFLWRVSELIQLAHGCMSALADMKDGVGEGMIILSSTPAEACCGVSGKSAHAFWGTFNGSSPKLRPQENRNDQLVRGCHYHLNCS